MQLPHDRRTPGSGAEGRGTPALPLFNYFPTRAGLLIGVADRILERELPAVGMAFSPASPTEFVDALCDLFEFMTGVNRTLTTARLVLFMEASHDAALRRAGLPWRRRGFLPWLSSAHMIQSRLAPR
jgi:hypothetical protein